MERIKEYSSGVFTIKEYLLDGEQDFPALLNQLDSGQGRIREIIPYVYEGEDPLEIDTKSFSFSDFEKLYPYLEEYGSGLEFDVIISTEGPPLTVQLSKGNPVITTSSLDSDAELEDYLGGKPEDLTDSGTEAGDELTPDAFLSILSVAERLKCNTRHCDTSTGRRESVAEHCWRTALMAMLVGGLREFAGTDIDRVIRMCLIHDLGEAFTGDIPTFEKTSSDESTEEEKLSGWIRSFPPPQRNEFTELLAEMKEQKTPEARLYKTLDKLEAIIQHNESDISSWLPLEYDLQFTYGKKETEQFAFMRALRARIDNWTEEKIRTAGKNQPETK